MHVGTRVEADSMVAKCVQHVCLVATTAVRRPTHCNVALVDQLTSRWDYEVVVAFFGAHDGVFVMRRFSIQTKRVFMTRCAWV